MKGPDFDRMVTEKLAEAAERYPDGNTYVINDFTNFIRGLNTATEIEIVCGCIFNNYKWKTFPNLATIKDLLNKAGIKIKPKEFAAESHDYCYKCAVCGNHFQMELGWCPVCYKKGIKNTPIKCVIVRDNMFILKGHSGCTVCHLWNDKSIGACCKEWGTGKHDEICRECVCRKCCNDEYMMRIDPMRYKRDVLGIIKGEENGN